MSKRWSGGRKNTRRLARRFGPASEGLLGGADSARYARDRIAQIPREQLVQTEAVLNLVEGGMSEDAATQAFLICDVATGIFGGMGDQALARIIAEGVGAGVARCAGWHGAG